MNYRDRREAERKKWRKVKLILLLCFAAFLFVLSVISFFVPAAAWQYAFSLPKVERREEGELRIHYLDVGQADSTLFEFPDGKTLLIDAGDSRSDARIIRYLNALKIRELDYLLLTHTDEDHCGSAAEIVKYVGVKNALLPSVYQSSTRKTSYGEFLDALEEKKTTGREVKRFDAITSSDDRYPYSFTVLFPRGYSDEEEEDEWIDSNALSTICHLRYGETTALFCGDTDAETLSSLVSEDVLGAFRPKGIKLNEIDILKVPHHGSEDGLTNELVSYLNFRTAVVSCGLGNIYGHPHEDVLEEFAKARCDVYRTDLQGTITASLRLDGEYEVFVEKE